MFMDDQRVYVFESKVAESVCTQSNSLEAVGHCTKTAYAQATSLERRESDSGSFNKFEPGVAR